jgi:monovalent cation:H+ antiporter, CPA1 family
VMVGLRVEVAVLPSLWLELLVLFASMLAARALLMYGVLPQLTRWLGAPRVGLRFRSIMFWGGLRGAIALALVLSLPDDFALKDELIALGTGVVLLTLFVQGLSIDWLVNRLGLATPPLADRVGEAETEVAAKEKALQRLPELSAGGLFSGAVAQKLSQRYRREHGAAEQFLADLRRAEVDAAAEQSLVFLRALSEEREHLNSLFAHGHLDERPFRRLLGMHAALADDLRHGVVPPERRLRPHSQALLSLAGRFGPLLPMVERLRQQNVAIDYQVAWGQFQCCDAVLVELDSIAPEGEPRAGLQHVYEGWRQEACTYLDDTAAQFPEFVHAMQERHATRLAVLAEIDVIKQRAHHGALPESSARRMEVQRDEQLDRLRRLAADKLGVDPAELLRKVPFMAGLPPEVLPMIVERLHRRTFAIGEKVIRQGQRDDSMFFIVRGVVRVYLYVDNVKRTVATLMAGDLFGEMALLRGEPRTATVIAVTPCLLLELRRADFMAVAELCPPLAEAVERADRERRAQLAAGAAQ